MTHHKEHNSKINNISNYNDTVVDIYKTVRQPIGINIIIKQIKEHFGNTPNDKIKILDCGCGCGNYLIELSKLGYNVIGIDNNDSMLKKINNINSSIKTFKVNITEGLPFMENEFDVIIINQVMHHFGDFNENFDKHQKLFGEFSRISKQNSLLSINTSSLEQNIDGLWWGCLIQKNLEMFWQRYCPESLLLHFLNNNNYLLKNKFICKEPFTGDKYFDMDFIFNENIRSTSTSWKYVNDNDYKQLINTLKAKNNLQSFFEERIKLLDTIGQSSFYIYQKNKN